jgi:hypothetical protein
MSEDRPVSTRSTLERADLEAQIDQLLKERESLHQSVLGLGSLVAQAVARGFIVAATPAGPAPVTDFGRPRRRDGSQLPVSSSVPVVPSFTASDPSALDRGSRG